jgi:hypothetical protein
MEDFRVWERKKREQAAAPLAAKVLHPATSRLGRGRKGEPELLLLLHAVSHLGREDHAEMPQ